MQRSKYLIAIVPPEPIAGELYKLKEHIRDAYQSKASLNSPAHITLHMPFEYKNEKKLINAFENFTIEPFAIGLENFGHFEQRVIFVDVKKNERLENCQRNIMDLCKRELNLLNAQYGEHPFHPHVTIAFRDLKKSQFEAAWNEFRSRTYAASFECRKISLLRHEGKFWREFS